MSSFPLITNLFYGWIVRWESWLKNPFFSTWGEVIDRNVSWIKSDSGSITEEHSSVEFGRSSSPGAVREGQKFLQFVRLHEHYIDRFRGKGQIF